MRSNDVFIGLTHDVFSFTMLQEIVANSLSLGLGSYKHMVGSLHLYDTNRRAARDFLNEGWQSTTTPMPAMPEGDPWPAIDLLLSAESTIRIGGASSVKPSMTVDPYWSDLVRLLQIFRYSRDRDGNGIRGAGAEMVSSIYAPFIQRRLARLS